MLLLISIAVKHAPSWMLSWQCLNRKETIILVLVSDVESHISFRFFEKYFIKTKHILILKIGVNWKFTVYPITHEAAKK